MITTRAELVSLIQKWGFLPMYRGDIHGFSVNELTPPQVWYTGEQGDPWEWKGPAISESGGVYGKFFRNKAAFISREWYPDFANYRRDGYDFDARYEDGLAAFNDKLVYELIAERGSILSKELKSLGGFGKNGRKGFDTVITRLQMQGYVIITNFEYQMDKLGRPYGIALARYSTPEHYFGEEFADHVYDRTPEKSKERIIQQLRNLLPDAEQEKLLKIVG